MLFIIISSIKKIKEVKVSLLGELLLEEEEGGAEVLVREPVVAHRPIDLHTQHEGHFYRANK